MSEVTKQTEETPAVAPAATVPETTETAPVTEAPATETPAVEEPVKAEETAEEPAKEEAKEVVPATDGQLGYKAPGLVKSFRFVKRYFWFSEEAVESKQLTSYFQNEKLSVAHPNAAWASQSGKGLLFFAKRAEDKATPAGIINLTDISDKLNGQKHTFQASTADERASWIAAIEAKSAEGKAAKEEIVGGEGYKSELEKFTKVPVVGTVAGATKKVTDETRKAADETTKAVESAVEPKEEKKEEKKEDKKEDKKSRSQSRKRASIFGNFLGKKEEQEEKKDEQKEEDKT
ncbi:hypothetical protein FQN49_001233 [Arthroderma sp. PD_2]|nr:hypothetical protein FQN49_001233 [Arthroderma sp. PD_2]